MKKLDLLLGLSFASLCVISYMSYKEIKDLKSRDEEIAERLYLIDRDICLGNLEVKKGNQALEDGNSMLRSLIARRI